MTQAPNQASQARFSGFYGVPAQIRRDHRDELVQASLAQLGRLFGAQAQRPVGTFLRDWALEPGIATEADLQPLRTTPFTVSPNNLMDYGQTACFSPHPRWRPVMGALWREHWSRRRLLLSSYCECTNDKWSRPRTAYPYLLKPAIRNHRA